MLNWKKVFRTSAGNVMRHADNVTLADLRALKEAWCRDIAFCLLPVNRCNVLLAMDHGSARNTPDLEKVMLLMCIMSLIL